jgi:hypothetical protein
MVLPIYWGARNAEEFFNFNSIFRVHSVDEIIKVCNDLTPEYYKDHLSNIKQNYNLALNYADYSQCVRRAINKALQI